MPIFHIEIDDKIFVYRLKGTAKFTFIAICMAENCSSKCKVQPSEDLLVSKDPQKRRLQLNTKSENFTDIRYIMIKYNLAILYD